ncbi:hypothetical protein CYMTET_54048 [Cymbomonas tetramitiformis]|uniref:Uncharacterized protein n=1 Tax=Cymbomonas tetramitiformis TaxID=36881 RepID=A0AAE0BGY8_9CHLO|nr:hypothetical protein CYMTET_54048 [Cymbomonas tetramitiformis]
MSAGSILQLPNKQWAVERVPSLDGHVLRVKVFLATADGETVHKSLPILPANADENLRISFAGAASTANGNTPLYVLAASERPHEYSAVRLDAENMLISSVAPTYTVRKNRLDELVTRSASKVPAAAYSSFLNEMWRNSENRDFWKSAEISGEEYSLLDESIDTEMGGTGVLPTAVPLTPAAESDLAANRGPGGSLLAYGPGETAKAAKEQNAEQAAQNWQSLLTLPKQRRSISHSNTIRYQNEYNHRYPRVVNAKDVKGCTFNIPIQYIIQAENYERIRDEDRAQVREEGLPKVYDGVYRFVCFGHQHSLTARRELHQEQPDNEAFQQIECKLYFNLQSDMVRFLADEQNTVDQNVKGKSHQQIIKSMRTGMQAQDWTEDGLVKQLEKHDPKTFKLPAKKNRKHVYEKLSKGDWANVNDWELFGGGVDNGKWFPVWYFLTSAQQLQIKAEVLQMNHISYANEYATNWSMATVRQETWDQIVRIMHAYELRILKGQTKTPTKESGKKRKTWTPESEIVDMTTETSGAEEALKDVGADLKKKKSGGKARSRRVPRSAGNTLSVGQPAQPLQQAIVKESEKKELNMSFFQTMLGFHSDVEVDYLNGALKKILTTEITIAEAIETLKRFKAQRNVQAWIVSQSGVENWTAFERKYGEIWACQESIERCIKAVKQGKSGRGGSQLTVPKAIVQFVADCNTWLSRCQAGEGDLGRLPVNYVPNTVALPSPLVEDGKEAEFEKEFEWKTVQTGYMIYKDELTKLENVPKMNYVGTILDVIYDFDTELSEHALSEPDLIKFIDAFAALTTSPDWTILIFCGFAQQTGFLKIPESKCNGGAQRIWWRKENQDVGANKAIRYNVLEAAVIGFQMADQESGEKSTRKAWMCDFDFSTKDAEAGSRANVLEGYSVVKQPFRDDGKVVCAHQKPQHLLIELINCHMMGPAPFARLNNDSSPNWILDAGCGVATATMAALRCGLNAVAFDSDQDMVNAASQRIGNINDEPNGDTECMSLEETAKLKEEARIEEENLKRAKEIADCAKDMNELDDEDGEEPAEDPAEAGTDSEQSEAGEGEEGEGGDEEEEEEAGEGAPGDNDTPAPAGDTPAE